MNDKADRGRCLHLSLKPSGLRVAAERKGRGNSLVIQLIELDVSIFH